MTGYWAAHAWLGNAAVADVRLVEQAGRWVAVEPGVPPAPADTVLPGLVLPGFANTHSHSFHRALRGRTHDDGGTFWTWRDRMYALAGRLEPDSYLALARAVYAEMVLAGVSVVGEFHYLHHRPGGARYPEPNAFGQVLIQAAGEAGIRITLLDACYLAGGLTEAGYLPVTEIQQRFSDGTAGGWAGRFADLDRLVESQPHARLGAAIHSVRAVPADQLATVVEAAAGRPLHAHVSEQPAENAATRAAFGRTPTELLAAAGFGGPLHTAVHATHLSPDDIAWYGTSRTTVSFCPTTERDLADGIGPASELAAAGAELTLGSDQHAEIDLLAEARALELDDRLASLQRGRFRPAQLVRALTSAGHASLGWADAGTLAVGSRADLVAVRLDTVRTAGSLPSQAILTAGAADVDTVLVDGRVIVRDGKHVLGDIGALLAEAIEPLWRD
jgi:formiminoglutamate deiminase